jgi:hypothetical protein
MCLSFRLRPRLVPANHIPISIFLTLDLSPPNLDNRPGRNTIDFAVDVGSSVASLGLDNELGL